jgi:hypothetical protein
MVTVRMELRAAQTLCVVGEAVYQKIGAVRSMR